MILDPQEMVEAERHLIEGGVNPESLMDEAGLGIANAVSQFFPQPGTLFVFVGHGHNGGDALVAARHLKARGWITELKFATSINNLKPLTSKKLHEFEKEPARPNRLYDSGQKLPLISIDGLLGIGASGDLRPGYLELAVEINSLRDNYHAVTFSLDIPSGLDGKSGNAYKGAVVADFTLTIAYPKTGLLRDHSINYVGRLVLIKLPNIYPLPGQGDHDAFLINSFSLGGFLNKSLHDTHKGINGHVGIIGGNKGMIGASVLSGIAALKGGAGLVTIIAREDMYSLIASISPPEIMIVPVKSYKEVNEMPLDTIAIGPGLGKGEWDSEVLELLTSEIRPLIIDADALNLIARNNPSELQNAPGPRLLTPHPGEMKRLDPEGNGTRRERAESFAKKTSSTVLLKGARTIIASDSATQPSAYNSTGNPGMSSAGVGDTLTGLCAALVTRGLKVFDAACLSSWINGRAAEIAIFDGNESIQSLTASDLPKQYGKCFNDLEKSAF